MSFRNVFKNFTMMFLVLLSNLPSFFVYATVFVSMDVLSGVVLRF